MTDLLEGAPAQIDERQVGVIDCDTHNYWNSPEEIFRFLPSRWHDYVKTFGWRKYPGSHIPRFWTSPEDRIPPSGRDAGTDVEFMATDHLDRFNIAYAVLIPLSVATLGTPNPDFAAALSSAVNQWQAADWLDREPRLRASLVIPSEDPKAAVAEIRRCAADRRFIQVQFSGRSAEPMGRRRYWPIYEACCEYELPVMSHGFGATGNPVTGTGWPSYYLEDHAGPPQTMQANLTSLVMEGVFELFPSLKVVSVENGFGWIPSLVWRMDNAWKLLKSEVPHLSRPPSEYVMENIYFSTQPVEEPPRPSQLMDLFGQFPALGDRLLFASDYPHWDGDDPERALQAIRAEDLKKKIMRENARALYQLP